MQLTRQGDYAIRTVLELAARPQDELVPVKEIASNQDVPLQFLNKIVQSLVKSGIVITVRGSKGGVKLGRAADQITLRDVVEAVEGPIALNRCVIREGACGREGFCRVHHVWRRAQAALLGYLEGVTFADLIK